MKTKSLKINKPCNENWNAMLPNNDGRFCNICDKTVIDFSGLSQREISEKIKSSKGSVCAKITSTQLKTPFLDIVQEKHFKLPYSKTAASIMLAVSMASVQSCENTEAKVNTEITIIGNSKASEIALNETNSKISSNKETILFSGKTIREDGRGIENAKITLITLQKLYSTYSKKDGSFVMEIPTEIIDDANVLRFEYDDIIRLKKDEINYHDYFETEDVILNEAELTGQYMMTPKQSGNILGGIGFYEYQEKYSPIVISDGVKVSFKEFNKAREGKKSSCNITNKGFMYFGHEAAIAIYGEEAKYGLYLFSNEIKKQH